MSDVDDRLRTIVVDVLGVDPDKVQREVRFRTDDGFFAVGGGTNDLGADSLDVVELVMAFEEEFGVEIPDDQVEEISTFGDAVDMVTAKVGDRG